ncbi:Fe-S cluster-binding ribosome biosynthesis protein [Coemansia aciculifera]|uniref:Fe-S cluster-binding ribosome biosynthesis protein n=1 Tax=Coemansia aciculifera TaxID=417176 RepID=A0ACC1M300_9FUNG|nr:Fe-S cluster-binding ribosome biosynthesis protein [Coemansia aciculifera]
MRVGNRKVVVVASVDWHRPRHGAGVVYQSEEVQDEEIERYRDYPYPSMTKTLGDFKLTVEGDMFSKSGIIVLLGENGMRKTILINLLAGRFETDASEKLDDLTVPYKPQNIAPKFPDTMRMLMLKNII